MREIQGQSSANDNYDILLRTFSDPNPNIRIGGRGTLAHYRLHAGHDQSFQLRNLHPPLSRDVLPLIAFDQTPEKGVDATEQDAIRKQKIQDALLRLLQGQIVVEAKPGQSHEAAVKEAKEKLAKLLADLKAERDSQKGDKATQEAFDLFQKLYSQRAIKPYNPIKLTWDDRTKADFEEKFTLQDATYTETRKRANALQDFLINNVVNNKVAELVTVDRNPPATYAARLEAAKTTFLNELRFEREQGVWGKRSQDAYQLYQKWFYGRALPENIAGLHSAMVQWPVNCPEPLQTGLAGEAEDPAFYEAMILSGKRIPAYKGNPAEALETVAFLQFHQNRQWLDDASRLIVKSRLNSDRKTLIDYIKTQGLPTSWLENSNDPRWVYDASAIIALYSEVGDVLEAMDHAHRGSKDKSFPFVPPPGTVFLRTDTTYRAGPPYDDIKRTNGTIEHYILKLPKNVRMDDTSTEEVYKEWLAWKEAYRDRTFDAIASFNKAIVNPNRLLSYTDQDVPHGFARLNAQGELIGVARANDPPVAGEVSRVPCNKIRTRSEVITKNGKKVVVQHVEAIKSGRFTYQDWNADVVARGRDQEFDLDESRFYSVLRGNRIELIKGNKLESELASQKRWLKAEHWGVPITDGLLTVLTLGEGFVVYRSARAGGGAAASLSNEAVRAELRREGMRLGFRGLMIGLGAMNSAGGRESTEGQLALLTRGIFFFVESIRGMAVDPSPLASNAPRWLRASGTALEACLVPLVVHDANKLRDRALGTAKENLFRDAAHILGDGKTYSPATADSFDTRKPDVLEREKEILAQWRSQLMEGRDLGTKNDIDLIFNRALGLLAEKPKEDAPQEELIAWQKKRDAYKSVLLDIFLLDRVKMGELVKANPELSNMDLNRFHNPDVVMKRWWDKDFLEQIEQRNREVGPDRRTAAAIALLVLSRQDDGTVPDQLASQVRRYPPDSKDARAYHLGISKQELFGYLKRDLRQTDNLSRNVLISSLLFQFRGIDEPQLAANFLGILTNPNSTPAERMQVLSDPHLLRLPTLIAELKSSGPPDLTDLKTDKLRQGLGVDRAALIATLKNSAQFDPDPNVRAMTAMVVYCLEHPDAAYGNDMLKHNNLRWQATPQTYAAEVKAFLKDRSNDAFPPAAPAGSDAKTVREAERKIDLARAARLDATLRRLELGDRKDQAERAELARTILSCWSPTDAELSVKVINALRPELIKLLSTDEQKALRESTIALISVPQVPEKHTPEEKKQADRQAAAMVELVRLTPFLLDSSDPASTQKFCAKLEQLVDPRPVFGPTVNPESEYARNLKHRPFGELPEAKQYPELLVEALRVLAASPPDGLGSHPSIDLIRARLTGEYRFEDKTFKVDISNAFVRMEAAKALAVLKDDKLGGLLRDAIAREREPAVAQVLRAIQALPEYGEQTPPIRSLRNQRAYEATGKRYDGDKYSSPEVSQAYLRGGAYNMLNGNTYTETMKATRDSRMVLDSDTSGKVIGYAAWLRGEKAMIQEALNTRNLEKLQAVRETRYKQWEALLEAAKGSGADAEKAKSALCYIMLHLDGGFSVLSKDDMNDAASWRRRAAEALVTILKEGGDKGITYSIIRDALKTPYLDPSTKQALLPAIRWMYEKSNEQLSAKVKASGMTSGMSKDHPDLIGIDRKELNDLVKQAMETEQGATKDGKRTTPGEKAASEAFRYELLQIYLKHSNPDELYGNTLAIMVFDPSQRIRDAARARFYEFRDGIDANYKSIPDNANANPRFGISRLGPADRDWVSKPTDPKTGEPIDGAKSPRELWADYLAEFKFYTANAEAAKEAAKKGGNELTQPVWNSDAMDKRDALVHAIFTGFKGCKFDGKDPQAEKEALELLSILLDETDPTIRLAVGRILSDSALSIDNPCKAKALLVCYQILTESDNDEHKKEARAQLDRFRLNQPVDHYTLAMADAGIEEVDQLSKLLTHISQLNPDPETKKKALEIRRAVGEQFAYGVIYGKRTVDPDLVSPDSLVLRTLFSRFTTKVGPMPERLNAAEAWFLAVHKNVEIKNFSSALDELWSIATTSKDPAMKERALLLTVNCLRAEMKATPDPATAGMEGIESHIRQRKIIDKFVTSEKPGQYKVFDHPEIWQVLKEVANKHRIPELSLYAHDILSKTTEGDIVSQLKLPLANDTTIKFRPIVEADDPRILDLLVLGSNNKNERVAQLYALVAKESTGVPESYKQLAVKKLAELAFDDDKDVRAQSGWIFSHLDDKLAPFATLTLLKRIDKELSQIKEGEKPTDAQTTKVRANLNVISELLKKSPLDSDYFSAIDLYVDSLSDSPFKAVPEFKQLIDTLIDHSHYAISGPDDQRRYWLVSSHPELRLHAAALLLFNSFSVVEEKDRQRAVKVVAYLAADGNSQALELLHKLQGDNVELAAQSLRRIANSLERKEKPDADKIISCYALVEQLYRRAGVDPRSEKYLHATLLRKSTEGADPTELSALRTQYLDKRTENSKDPAARFCPGALDRYLEDHLSMTRKHGKDSLEAARAELALAKVAQSISFGDNDRLDRAGAARFAEEHTRNALEMLTKKLPADSPELCDVLYRAGVAEAKQGKYAEAQKHLEQALAIYKQHPEKFDPIDGVWITSQLAETFIRQDNFLDAAKAISNLLEISTKVGAAKTPEAISALKRVADVLNPIGNRDRARILQAESLFRHTLQLCEMNLDKSDLQTARVRALLAVNLDDQGKDNEALPLYQSAIGRLRAERDLNKRELAALTQQYAYCLNRLGKNDEAKQAHEEARQLYYSAETERTLDLQRRKKLAFGDGDPAIMLKPAVVALNTSVDHDQAALLTITKEKGERSVEAAKQRLEISRKLYTVSLNLDNAKDIATKSERAEWQAQKALGILREKLGNDHPDVIDAHYQLALVQLWNGEPRKAAENFKFALEICKKHPDKLKNGDKVLIASRLVVSCIQLGDREQLEKAVLDLREFAREKGLASEKGDISLALKQAALNLLIVRNEDVKPAYDDIEELFNVALDLSNSKSGPDSLASARLNVCLASCLVLQGKHGKAVTLFEKAIAVFEKQEPLDAVELSQALQFYSMVLHRLRRPTEAKRASDRAQQLRQE
jgi:hypothetical protein